MLGTQTCLYNQLEITQSKTINPEELKRLNEEIAKILKNTSISEREKSDFKFLNAIIESKVLLHSEYSNINRKKYTEILNTFQRKSHITLDTEKIDKLLDNYKNLLDICTQMEKNPEQYQNAPAIKLYLGYIIKDLNLMQYLINKFSSDIKANRIKPEQAKKLKTKLLHYKQTKQTDMFEVYIDHLNSYIELNKIRPLDSTTQLARYLNQT